ncbi:hypothetical protein JOL62DRAFT_573404 [Phyllosticta paracitricarpa]|uniref:Uncharacterized protein n=1 Tax=Phyllosticta paracitricarpa TaxID=2016321 RepID=A0ABR1N7T0_9PEZI
MAQSITVPSPSHDHGRSHPTMPHALPTDGDFVAPSPDLSTPSDEDSPAAQDYPPQNPQSLVGFSIGHAQTHYASPTTPAAEKAAAMEDLPGGPFGDTEIYSLEGTREPQTVGSSGSSTPVTQEIASPPRDSATQKDAEPRKVSPTRPKRHQRSEDLRASLRESLTGHRRRASSGASTTKKLRPFNLPSLPKSPNLLNFSIPGFTSSNDRRSSQDGTSKSSSPSPKRTSFPDAPKPSSSLVPLHSRRSTVHLDGSSASRYQRADNASLRPPPSRQLTRDSLLRRSASDESLVLYRSLSKASSLGDDTRFEHVQEQVNSRIKAIKDSFQDANFKIRGIPSIPNFNNLAMSLTDLTRGRPGSLSMKNSSASHRKGTPSPLKISKTPVEGPKRSPRHSVAGMTSNNAAQQPFLNQAISGLKGDVVILGGYRGSILRSAEPPHRQLWVPIKVGLNLRRVDLEVGLDPEDEETMEERVIPGGMLTHVGPVDISRRLFKRLRASEHAQNGELRVHDYGYDWRLSPHLLSRRLIDFLESLPCNKPDAPADQKGAIVIAHSLGGLITRHAINQRPDLFSGVVYAGVPTTCVNILGPLRNGDDVLLSSRVLTAQVNFSIRTSFALLPLSGKCFIDKYTKEEYPVDFFDVNTWIEGRLSPCIAPALPPLKNQLNIGFDGIMRSMSSVLPTIGRKSSISKSPRSSTFSLPGIGKDEAAKEASAAKTAKAEAQAEGGRPNRAIGVQMGANQGDHAAENNASQNNNPATAVTIPRDKAIEYLTRTLAETKKFKQELDFRDDHGDANLYPPAAVIYGKSIPTVYGAKVVGREGIKHADSYDELAFASGDGVVLARAAMLPPGYAVVRGGVVSSDRGHVTLLGDLEAVGRCLAGVVAAREAGVGRGPAFKKHKKTATSKEEIKNRKMTGDGGETQVNGS